jgi:hypothetical protein
MYKIIGADGSIYGPAAAEELRQWISEGRANARSQIQAEGSPDWRPLGTFPDFAAALAETASRMPFPLPDIARAASAKTNGMALAGFILGLLSVPSVCCCCFTPPCSVLGLIFSCIGLSQARRNPMQGGKGLAVAGIILSILGMFLLFAWLVFVVANAAFAQPGLQ